MSATGRSERGGGGLDFFPTEPWCVRLLLDALASQPVHVSLVNRFATGPFVEPAVGDGAIVRAVDAWRDERGMRRAEWLGIDVVDRDPGCRFVRGNFATSGERLIREALVDALPSAITNPPFKLALAFAEQALRVCRFVALLLRVNWLASEERAAFLDETRPDVYVLPQRPSFRVDGDTDATEYSWIVWGGPLGGGQWRVLPTLPKAERTAGRGPVPERRQVELAIE